MKGLLVILFITLLAVVLIIAAVSWWTSGDPLFIFNQLAHSYHSCNPRHPLRSAC